MIGVVLLSVAVTGAYVVVMATMARALTRWVCR